MKKRRLSQRDFIERAKAVHGDKYGYGDSVFQNVNTPIAISCTVHGVFYQKPQRHFDGHGCRKCNVDSNRKTQDEVLKEIQTHKNIDTFDLSRVVYTGADDKIEIVCKIHDESFWIHTGTLRRGHGCPKCGREKTFFNPKKYYGKTPELANKSGILYLIWMLSETESFLKVGITRSPERRFSEYYDTIYCINRLEWEYMSNMETVVLEEKLLTYIKDNELQYIPKQKFKGYTECAKVEALDGLKAIINERTEKVISR